MKKLMLIFASIVFLLFFSTKQGNAQQQTITTTPSVEVATSSGTTYQLPYPGILPDNPLYKLKTLRDKIVLFLIHDPYKKAEKYQEFADKQLFAALKLAEKDDMPLAVHTAFKGEHQMTLLVFAVKEAVYTGRPWNPEITDRAYKATLIHQELLQGMLDRAEGENAESIKTIMEFSTRNRDELSKLEKEVTTPLDDSDEQLKEE